MTTIPTTQPGTKMLDGSVYAGLTADGKFHVFAMAKDLKCSMTFNDAAKAVKKLNEQKELGHDDWKIPGLGALKVLWENLDKGSFKGTFDLASFGDPSYPGYYLSSAQEGRGVWAIHLSQQRQPVGDVFLKDVIAFNCRPVRLVPVKS